MDETDSQAAGMCGDIPGRRQAAHPRDGMVRRSRSALSPGTMRRHWIPGPVPAGISRTGPQVSRNIVTHMDRSRSPGQHAQQQDHAVISDGSQDYTGFPRPSAAPSPAQQSWAQHPGEELSAQERTPGWDPPRQLQDQPDPGRPGQSRTRGTDNATGRSPRSVRRSRTRDWSNPNQR